ncbi:MAG: NAD(P)H-dependent oxidoreductase [Bacteroidota bacterium]
MITIISSSNRKGNATYAFAEYYFQRIQSKTEEAVHLLDLTDLPTDIVHLDMYHPESQSKGVAKIQDEFILPANKFVFVVPEYNGSFPGILKLFLDACSIRMYRETFFGKKAALVGIASGRAGNLRGMDHLTGVLHHVGTHVLPNKLPISSIKQLLDENRSLTDEGTQAAIDRQIDEFLAF